MNKNIHITVADKIATNNSPRECIVCGNSDYFITFSFDSEWDAETTRTARFVYYKDGKSSFQDCVFVGDTVQAPVMSGVSYVLVGVYAGNLRTSSPARITCKRSILCDGGTPVDPPADVYAQLMALLNEVAQDLPAAVKSAEDAATSAAAAAAARDAAEQAKTDAEAAAQSAGKSETNAANAATSANLAKDGAEAAASQAAASELDAEGAAAAATASAAAADQAERNATASASAALTAQGVAQSAAQSAETAASAANAQADRAQGAAQSADQSAQTAAGHASEARQAAEEAKNAAGSGGGSGVDVTAQPGQMIIVKSVDENGKPTEWEAVDRTHYTEGGMVEILPECQLTYDEDDGCFYINTIPSEIKEGETYAIELNGVEYECTAIRPDPSDETYVFGNLGMLNPELANTGEPFVLVITDMQTVVYVFDGTTELTISIYHNAEVVHKLDSKYLPEGHQFGDMEVDILPETEMALVTNPDVGMAMDMFIPSEMVLPNRVYTVKFNGAEYECAPNAIEAGFYILGNTAVMGGDDNGLPFVTTIAEDDGDVYGVVISLIGEVTTNVSIKGIHPVPIVAEYAPEPVFIDLKALGFGEINNNAVIQFDVPDDAMLNIDEQMRVALKHGLIKLKFDYKIKTVSMTALDSHSVGEQGGFATIPMTIRKWGSDYVMSALYDDNIIYVWYSIGTFYAVSRRLTLATEV